MAGPDVDPSEQPMVTGKQIATAENALPTLEKMKTVAAYDQYMADSHPGNKALATKAHRSQSQALDYYHNKAGGLVYNTLDADGRMEADRQGRPKFEKGLDIDEWGIDKIADKAASLKKQIVEPDGKAPLDPNTGKPFDAKAIEAMRLDNNRTVVLDQVREARAQQPAGQEVPARPAGAER